MSGPDRMHGIDMGIANEVMDVLRDWKRIGERPPTPGAGRADLWRTHVRLKAAQLLRRRSGEARVLGYRVAYLDLVNFVHLFREIFVNRVYYVALGGRAPTIIDCGSNIGMSILFFKDAYPDARIIAFEPHPLVHRTLARNVEGNMLRDVVLHQKALADRSGTIGFFANAGVPGALDMGMFAKRGGIAPFSVEADVLSRYVDGEVDLLKMDIEGAEELVLRELAEQDKLRRIRHIACEYHHHLDTGTDRLSRILATLEGAGFGYQIAAHCGPPAGQYRYQDVMVYAYRKDGREVPAAPARGGCQC